MYKISWDEFETLSLGLAKKIVDSGRKFDAVIAISRGGLLLGRILSGVLNLPMAVISAKYSDDKKEYLIDDKVSFLYKLQGDVLLVDDLLEDVSLWILKSIKKNHPSVKEISLAGIFYKTSNDFKPDFYINNIQSNMWILFPYQNKALETDFDSEKD